MYTTTDRNRLPLRSRVPLQVVAAASAVLGLLVVVLLVVRAVTTPSRSTVSVDGMTLVNSSTPPFTQKLPGLQAYYSSLNLRITDPPTSLAWLDFAQTATGAAGILAMCAILVWLCLATLRGRPFGATAPWVLISAGLTLVASSIASDLLAGRIQAAVVDLYGIESTSGPGESFGVGTAVTLDGLGTAAALCVLGATFALGHRLQRDDDRLI